MWRRWFVDSSGCEKAKVYLGRLVKLWCSSRCMTISIRISMASMLVGWRKDTFTFSSSSLAPQWNFDVVVVFVFINHQLRRCWWPTDTTSTRKEPSIDAGLGRIRTDERRFPLVKLKSKPLSSKSSCFNVFVVFFGRATLNRCLLVEMVSGQQSLPSLWRLRTLFTLFQSNQKKFIKWTEKNSLRHKLHHLFQVEEGK